MSTPDPLTAWLGAIAPYLHIDGDLAFAVTDDGRGLLAWVIGPEGWRFDSRDLDDPQSVGPLPRAVATADSDDAILLASRALRDAFGRPTREQILGRRRERRIALCHECVGEPEWEATLTAAGLTESW